MKHFQFSLSGIFIGKKGGKLTVRISSSKAKLQSYFDETVQNLMLQHADDLYLQGERNKARKHFETAKELMKDNVKENIQCK